MPDPVRRVTIAGRSFAVTAGVHERYWDDCEAGLEATTFAVLVSRLGPGTTFVDVGSWIGPMSLVAAACGAQVIAYEPDPAAADEVEANIKLNPDFDITVQRVALWTSTGTRRLRGGPVGLGESMSSLTGRSGRVNATSVATIDIDEASRSWPADALVKIDVEGAEYRIVPRLRPFIAAHRPTMILSVHGYDLRATLSSWPAPLRRLIHHGRHAARVVPLLVALRGYRAIQASDHADPTWHKVRGWELAARMWERELLLDSHQNDPLAAVT
jgi:FkbM family methyltransferase